MRRPSSRTVREYNAAVRTGVPFNPAVRDGRGTRGLAIPEIQLGQPPRRAPVRGVPDHLRHHLHLRRSQGRRGMPGARHRGRADSRALRGRRAGRRALLLQLPGRHGARLRRGLRPAGRRRGPAPAPPLDPGRSRSTIPTGKQAGIEGRGESRPDQGRARTVGGSASACWSRIDASLVGWLVTELSRATPRIPTIEGFEWLDLRWVALLVVLVFAVLAGLVYVAMVMRTDELGDIE